MEPDNPPPPSILPQTDRADAAPARGNAVYIIDDDRMVRRSLNFVMEMAGFNVRAFVSGRDFLDEVDLLTSGCVLLDLRMPGMDGMAVLEELGDRVRRFPVVIMTGHGDLDTAVNAMKRGASDFLEKPFTDVALLEILSALFETLPAQAEADDRRAKAAARVAGLTPRERELLRGLVAGLSNKGMAKRLDISVRTIEMHRGNLMERLGAGSLAEVVQLAILAGIEPL